VPRNSGKRRTASKCALLVEIEKLGGEWSGVGWGLERIKFTRPETPRAPAPQWWRVLL
jgi:hypothetical protein